MWVRVKSWMTPPMLVALLALFVALGGTTWAATGGSFILGKGNAADATTSLAAPVAAASLKVANQSDQGSAVAVQAVAKAGRGVSGSSDSWQGVFGHSNSNAGVVGESSGFDGVFGQAHQATTAGVSGHNDAAGFAVWGGTTGAGTAISGHSPKGRGVEGFSDSYQGVYGHSKTNAGVVGESTSFDGVFGQAHGNLTAGVSGHNDVGGFGVWGEGSVGVYGQSEHAGVEGSSASVDGYGLYGKNEQGLALFLDGDAEQYPGTNGLVKALLFVDPNLPSDPIRQCFNGTVDKPYATSDDCQFSYQRLGVGEYVIGFGNELDITNRFMFVQPRTQTLVTATMFVYSSDNHSQGVVTWDPDGQPVDSAFFVVVL